MTEVFLPSGTDLSGVSDAVSASLIGNYYASIDQQVPSGLNLVTPWGGGILSRLTPTSTSEQGEGEAGESNNATAILLDQMKSLAAARAPITNYNFRGLIGPEGMMGPAGPPGVGVGGLPGADGSDGASGQLLLVAEQPKFDGTFQSDTPTAGKVAWTTGTLAYQGTNYTIDADATGTTLAYIYWDKNDVPTTFHSTDDRLVAIGTDRWIVCYNDGGAAYAISSDQMIPGTIIIDGTILEDALADNAVTTAKLALLAVQTENISADAITNSKIADDAIEAPQIKANAVTAAKILAGEIGTNHLGALTITADKIASNAITSSKIMAGEIGANHIAAWSITAGKLAVNSVVTANIVAGNITANLMAINSITAANGAIANLAVLTANIADLNVTTLKIAGDAVTGKVSAYTSGYTSELPINVFSTIQSVVITTIGSPVLVWCSAMIWNYGSGTKGFYWKILRDSTIVASDSGSQAACKINATYQAQLPFSFGVVDSPAAGAHTYSFQLQVFANEMKAGYRSLTAMETKK